MIKKQIEDIKLKGAIAKLPITDPDKFIVEVNLNSNETVLVLDANMVVGSLHVISAYEHAQRAFRTNRARTKNVKLETLIYIAGTTQIGMALNKLKLKAGQKEMILVFFGNDWTDNKITDFLKIMNLSSDDTLLEKELLKKLKNFGITENELKNITEERTTDIILEKVAFVDIL